MTADSGFDLGPILALCVDGKAVGKHEYDEPTSTYHNVDRYESSTTGSRKTKKKATVLALGYNAMMC
jgi:hypothetical protein